MNFIYFTIFFYCMLYLIFSCLFLTSIAPTLFHFLGPLRLLRPGSYSNIGYLYSYFGTCSNLFYFLSQYNFLVHFNVILTIFDINWSRYCCHCFYFLFSFLFLPFFSILLFLHVWVLILLFSLWILISDIFCVLSVNC